MSAENNANLFCHTPNAEAAAAIESKQAKSKQNEQQQQRAQPINAESCFLTEAEQNARISHIHHVYSFTPTLILLQYAYTYARRVELILSMSSNHILETAIETKDIPEDACKVI